MFTGFSVLGVAVLLMSVMMRYVTVSHLKKTWGMLYQCADWCWHRLCLVRKIKMYTYRAYHSTRRCLFICCLLLNQPVRFCVGDVGDLYQLHDYLSDDLCQTVSGRYFLLLRQTTLCWLWVRPSLVTCSRVHFAVWRVFFKFLLRHTAVSIYLWRVGVGDLSKECQKNARWRALQCCLPSGVMAWCWWHDAQNLFDVTACQLPIQDKTVLCATLPSEHKAWKSEWAAWKTAVSWVVSAGVSARYFYGLLCVQKRMLQWCSAYSACKKANKNQFSALAVSAYFSINEKNNKHKHKVGYAALLKCWLCLPSNIPRKKSIFFWCVMCLILFFCFIFMPMTRQLSLWQSISALRTQHVWRMPLPRTWWRMFENNLAQQRASWNPANIFLSRLQRVQLLDQWAQGYALPVLHEINERMVKRATKRHWSKSVQLRALQDFFYAISWLSPESLSRVAQSVAVDFSADSSGEAVSPSLWQKAHLQLSRRLRESNSVLRLSDMRRALASHVSVSDWQALALPWSCQPVLGADVSSTCWLFARSALSAQYRAKRWWQGLLDWQQLIWPQSSPVSLPSFDVLFERAWQSRLHRRWQQLPRHKVSAWVRHLLEPGSVWQREWRALWGREALASKAVLRSRAWLRYRQALYRLSAHDPSDAQARAWLKARYLTGQMPEPWQSAYHDWQHLVSQQIVPTSVADDWLLPLNILWQGVRAQVMRRMQSQWYIDIYQPFHEQWQQFYPFSKRASLVPSALAQAFWSNTGPLMHWVAPYQSWLTKSPKMNLKCDNLSPSSNIMSTVFPGQLPLNTHARVFLNRVLGFVQPLLSRGRWSGSWQGVPSHRIAAWHLYVGHAVLAYNNGPVAWHAFSVPVLSSRPPRLELLDRFDHLHVFQLPGGWGFLRWLDEHSRLVSDHAGRVLRLQWNVSIHHAPMVWRLRWRSSNPNCSHLWSLPHQKSVGWLLPQRLDF